MAPKFPRIFNVLMMPKLLLPIIVLVFVVVAVDMKNELIYLLNLRSLVTLVAAASRTEVVSHHPKIKINNPNQEKKTNLFDFNRSILSGPSLRRVSSLPPHKGDDVLLTVPRSSPRTMIERRLTGHSSVAPTKTFTNSE